MWRVVSLFGLYQERNNRQRQLQQSVHRLGGSTIDDLIFASASQLAAAIRQRQVSAVEVVEAYLAQIARHNPALNAIVTLDEQSAMQRAREADADLARDKILGPLHGVPVTVKDVLETAGLRTTSNSRRLAHYVPQRDATVVARLRAAGAIILGKTNTPRLASDIQVYGPLFARGNNPWDLNRTPGGSSGGGAAAVAAGLSPLDMGSDLAGSVRIPAHFCGVFALKPTENRVSIAGHIPELPGKTRGVRHMQVIGPLARSVADLRLWLSLCEGPDGRDWEVPPMTEPASAPRALREYRIAWTDTIDNVPVTADTRAALTKLAGALEQLGCRVEQLTPPGFDFDSAHALCAELAAEALVDLKLPRLLLPLAARTQLRKFKGSPLIPGIKRMAGLDLRVYLKALARRDVLITLMERFLTDWDVWLCPVCPMPAFTHRETGTPIEVDGQRLPYWLAGPVFTQFLNPLGNPVVVLPLAQSAAGLPIGVQVIGRRWRDMQLLDVAEKLTEVIGPFRRPPGY